MPIINTLKPAEKRKVIKIYLDAFVRQPVPCPTCPWHCCQGCQEAKGYFSSSFGSINSEETKAHVEEMKKKYGWTDAQRRYDAQGIENWKNQDQGFFVAGKGCRIPYKERSAVCVGFTCGRMNLEQQTAGSAAYNALIFRSNK